MVHPRGIYPPCIFTVQKLVAAERCGEMPVTNLDVYFIRAMLFFSLSRTGINSKKKQNRLAQDGRSDVKNKKHTFPRYSQANDEREERHCCRCVIINSDASIATSTGHKILLALSQR